MSNAPYKYMTTDLTKYDSWLVKQYNIDDTTYKKLSDKITVTGTPSDVESGMYDGNIKFVDSDITSGGRIDVTVNGSMRSLYGGFSQYTSLPHK